MNTRLAHAGHPELRAADVLRDRGDLPARRRVPREPLSARAGQRAVGVRTAADASSGTTTSRPGSRGSSRSSFTTSIIVAAVMVPGLGAAVRRRRLRVRDDAVQGLEDALLPVHPRADHPDRGDDRAPVLRRARDGAARHLLGADPPRDRRARSRSGSSGCAPRSCRRRRRCWRPPGSTARRAGRRSGGSWCRSRSRRSSRSRYSRSPTAGTSSSSRWCSRSTT